MIRCSSIAKLKVILNPGDELIVGCELIDGSIFIGGTKEGNCSLSGENYNTQEDCETHGGVWTDNAICVGGIEVMAPLFVGEDDMCAYAGANGATVIWPETGNDVFRFRPGEGVPIGTEIHQGEVFDNGEWHNAPYTVTGEGAYAGPEDELDSLGDDGTGDGTGDGSGDGTGDGTGDGSGDGTATIGSVPPDDQPDGFCDPLGILSSSLPDEAEKELLWDLANLQIPELPSFNLSGVTAYITKQLTKLSSVAGKLQQKVQKLTDQVKMDPEELCTPPVKAVIRKQLEVTQKIMKLLPTLRKLQKGLNALNKAMKLIRRGLKITPPWIVPIIEGIIGLMNVMGLVNMMTGVLTTTVAQFSAIIPTLQAQLMSLLSQCAAESGQEPPTDKESCEAAGGVWIDQSEIDELLELANKMQSETNAMSQIGAGTGEDGTGDGTGGGDSVGFCSVPGHTDKQSCEDAGGVWTEIDSTIDLSTVDTSPLTKELAFQLEELNKCFADEDLQEYLDEL